MFVSPIRQCRFITMLSLAFLDKQCIPNLGKVGNMNNIFHNTCLNIVQFISRSIQYFLRVKKEEVVIIYCD